jgi:hypothetical protein
MSRHRAAPVRPRYGRIAAASASLAVTGIALLGGVGALPSAADDSRPRTDPEASSAPSDGPSVSNESGSGTETRSGRVATGSEVRARREADRGLPEDSGSGKRVVFSEDLQRVWLVDDRDRVVRTYPVSGSVYDNLDPGSFNVYSRSEQAFGIDDSGSMKWFVRFSQGDTGAAIGFHTIPVDDGAKVQTISQLGTPLSHGCIRQRTADAKALWDFAPVGTTVVVV